MTSTKPSEPSDERKSGPIEYRRGGELCRIGLVVAANEGKLNQGWLHGLYATPADIIAALAANPELMAACADGLSRHTGELRERLTEAQSQVADLERCRQAEYDERIALARDY